jgi:hypothetical protein
MIQEYANCFKKGTQNWWVSQAEENFDFWPFFVILYSQLNHIEVKVEAFGGRESAP